MRKLYCSTFVFNAIIVGSFVIALNLRLTEMKILIC